jgi:hypothetical protein
VVFCDLWAHSFYLRLNDLNGATASVLQAFCWLKLSC